MGTKTTKTKNKGGDFQVNFKGKAAKDIRKMASEIKADEPEEVVVKALALLRESIGGTVTIDKKDKRVTIKDLEKAEDNKA